MADVVADELVLGRFRLEVTAGGGATGTTWRARDEATGELVAVKIMNAVTISSWKAFDLFERETQVLQSLHHPGIPAFVAASAPDSAAGGPLILVSAWVPGETLAALLKRGGHVEGAAAERIIEQLLDILGYIHACAPPVIHRDVKPGNIMLRPDGSVALIDFGVARAGGAASDGLTMAGTASYMAPEQLLGQASPASDLYGLGTTLLHLLSGREPGSFELSSGKITFPDSAIPDARLRRLVRALLEPAPEHRPASARSALRLLHEPIPDVPTTPPGAVSSVGPARRPLLDLGASPRDPKGPERAIFERLRPDPAVLGGFAVAFVVGLGGSIIVGLAVDALAGFATLLGVGSVLVWFADARKRRVRRRAPELESPGAWLFVHGAYAIAEVTSCNIQSSQAILKYVFRAADGTQVHGSTIVSHTVFALNPIGTRLGVLYHPEKPRQHRLITEDLVRTPLEQLAGS